MHQKSLQSTCNWSVGVVGIIIDAINYRVLNQKLQQSLTWQQQMEMNQLLLTCLQIVCAVPYMLIEKPESQELTDW